MKEPKPKLSNFLIRVLVFLIFFAMFLVGVDHFVSKLPTNMQIPIIKVKREVAIIWNRAKLSNSSLFSDDSLSQSIKVLMSRGDTQVVKYCHKFRDSKSQSLKVNSVICLLSFEEGEPLKDIVSEVTARDDNDPLKRTLPNILQNNPSAQSILSEMLDDGSIGPSQALELKTELLLKGKGKEKWRQELKSWLELEGESREKTLALEQLSKLEPDNPKLIEYHRKRIKNRSDSLMFSLQFQANYDIESLRKELPSLVDDLKGADRLFVISKVRQLCPEIKIDHWKQKFLDDDQFSVKKEILKTLLSYKDFRTSGKIDFFKEDLKLKPAQIERLQEISKKPGLITCP